MLNRIKYLLLMMMLMAGGSAMSQRYVVDKVCAGAERHYRVDGEAGSSYTWTLTDPVGVLSTLPETGDSVTIGWNGALGIYTLATTQHGINGCDAVLELGTIEVFDVPYAYAGSNATLCNPAPYTLAFADAGNWTSLEWTTSGDGWFDDITALHATYTFGANDILTGSVTLTLTAQGLGYPGSCPPAGSTMIITLDNLLVDASSTPASCSGVVDGRIQLSAAGGTGPYTYTLNGMTNNTGLFTGLAEGIYSYMVEDVSGCSTSGEDTITAPAPVASLFDPIGPLCQFSLPPALPLTSLNGVTGTWSPATINTATTGAHIFTFTPEAGECAHDTTMTIVITEELTPLFAQIGPLCQNSTPPILPLTSDNGITGTWSPAVINTTTFGTTTYTFSPDAGVCAFGTTMIIEVIEEVTPQFVQIGPLCQNSTPPILPLTSLNGVTGTWSPAVINTAAFGTTVYTFTPNSGMCVLSATMEIDVTEELTPLFAQIGPLCVNSTPPALPLTSLNGIAGTWSPAVINTTVSGSTAYTFTPAAGLCAVDTMLLIQVTDELNPLFAQIGPLCVNSTPPALPSISLNGISGTWSPAVITTSAIGIFDFTFTPDPGQCAGDTTLSVAISDEITPAFIQIGPLCQYSVPPDLQATSDNGITGTWNPSAINTSIPGTVIYTFTPNAGQCAVATTMTITVTEELIPQFAQIGPLCQYSTPPDLPLISLNGVEGTWSPAVINTTTGGITTYTFTPDVWSCAIAIDMNIRVMEEVTVQFAQIGPLCQNTTPPALPLTSDNGITGTWSPAVINTLIPGTVNYTFTPDTGQCALGVQMDITITTGMSPEFTQIGPLCLNSTPPLLPLTSDNGINGTWNPSAINTAVAGAVTYTFTASAGQCAADTNMVIVVSDTIKPTFTQMGPLCLNSTPPELPLISNDSITGTWSPAVISTTSIGVTTYTFTPDGAGCAFPTTMEITVSSPEIITIEITNSANGQSNGHITIVATGTEPMQYSLDGINWQSSSTFTGLAPGTDYTAWVMDANGCIVTQDFDIGNVVVGDIELVSGRVTDCVGAIRELDVNVYNFKDVASFRLQLTYDPLIVRFAGFSNIHSSLVAANLIPTEVSPGVLEISYTHPGQVTLTDGDLLFNLRMEGIAPGVTDLKWQWLECVVMTSVGYVEPSTIVVNAVAEIFANPELTAYKDDAFCEGDSTTLYAESNMPDLTYTWTHPRGIKHTGDTWNLGSLSVMDSGRYVVEAKIDQCSTLDTVNIIVYPAPDLHISYADTICFGNPVVLDPGGDFVSYEWNDGSNMSTLIAYEAGVYWVKIVDFNGCRALDSVSLKPCIMEVLIPNAFTPNGDGLNDDFKPIFIGFEPTNYRMDIYSKWGQLLFTTSNLEQGWDGTINGQPAPHDTFVYVVSFEAPAYVTRVGLHSPVTGRVSVLR